ncbi:MAG: glycosyltransferase family 1 protein [Magnetococcales bacterium]|nr:glycosyltransferase family 1 protein [Magnetococcales bacterium]
MTIQRVSIFLPSPTPFYKALLKQMIRGFEQLGIQTNGDVALLDEEALTKWVRNYEPDLIIEMNRPRSEIPFLKKEILHVAWIVDFNGRSMDHFKGSDITYFFCGTWVTDFPYDTASGLLSPGACTETYRSGSRRFESTLSFVGHISAPWSEAELSRPMNQAGHALYTFGEFLPHYRKELDNYSKESFKHDDYFTKADRIYRELTGTSLKIDDDALLYDIGCRVVRFRNRQKTMDTIVKETDSIRLYGPENWAKWPEYRAYYEKFLTDPEEIRRVYQSSRFNVHEGVGMHFRTMDCMSSGGLIMYRDIPENELFGGLEDHFEHDRHYIRFHLEEFPEVFRSYVNRPDHCAEIRRNAMEEIRANHTWRHRAIQIMNDINKL